MKAMGPTISLERRSRGYVEARLSNSLSQWLKVNRQRSRSSSQSSAPPVVLVVEDEFFIRTMIADELRTSGFGVIECGTADDALDILRSGTSVSIIFSDIRMPGSMDGVGLLHAIRQDYPELQIVLTSSHPPYDGVVNEVFVPKPYDPQSVVQLLDNCLTGTTPEPRR